MIFYIGIGLVSGIISGMGIGGGTVLIPALVIFFQMNQRTAQNINLIYFLPTALIALATHIKAGNVEKKLLWGIILYGLIGAAAGSVLAMQINPDWLRRLFGLFLLGMGILEIVRGGTRR